MDVMDVRYDVVQRSGATCIPIRHIHDYLIRCFVLYVSKHSAALQFAKALSENN